MTIQPIYYDGRLAALAGTDTWHLAEHLQQRPAEDPERRMVIFMVACAHDVATGELTGPYDDHMGRAYARAALIPEDALRRDHHRPDSELADELHVPLEELLIARAERPPRRRRRLLPQPGAKRRPSRCRR